MSAGPEPILDGLTYIRRLGRGGFADVFLYRQEWPDRNVAVKVLRHDVDEEFKARFKDEANLMAQVSAHPAIVTIYAANVSSDGRPYLVMEHCPYPHLGQRAKEERFQVQEALRTGIQLAGAVESAHRLDIIHRDIKPANILVTAFRHPALTDFGISVTPDQAQSYGVSVPWAPPEQIDGEPVTVRSDVYALAATIYTLLAGRSPFGGGAQDKDLGALAERVCTQPVPPIGRDDVPDNFEQTLRTAMSKDPRARYASAIEFGRALQRVQHGLNLTVTQIEAMDYKVEPENVWREDSGNTVIVAPRKAEDAPERWAREGHLGTDPLAVSGGTGGTGGSDWGSHGGSSGRPPPPPPGSGPRDGAGSDPDDESGIRTRVRAEPAAPSRRRRLPVWAVVGGAGALLVAVGAAVGWAVAGRDTAQPSAPITAYVEQFGVVDRHDLDKGDCLTDRPTDGMMPSKVATGPCAQAHYGEIIFKDDLPWEGSYSDSLAEQVRPTCDHALALYENLPDFTPGDYRVKLAMPGEEGWQAGDRRINCVVYRVDGQPMYGSLSVGQGLSTTARTTSPTATSGTP